MKSYCIIFCGLLMITSCNRGGSSTPSDAKTINQRDQGTTRAAGLTKLGKFTLADNGPVSIQCVDARTCWINNERAILYSTDGGKHWQAIFDAPIDEEIQVVDFIDSEKGWLIREGKFYKSEDGGKSWLYQASPIEYPRGEMRSFFGIADGKTGWLVGGTYRPQTNEELRIGVPNNTKDPTGKLVLEEAIFRTQDSGTTWLQQSIPSPAAGRILQVKFFDANRGVALGESNFYYTDNGGDTWRSPTLNTKCTGRKYLSDSYDSSPSDVATVDGVNWWISYDDGRIIRSADGGRNWCDAIAPGSVAFAADDNEPKYFRELQFLSSQSGWGLGWDRFVYKTEDGGKSWVRFTSDIKFDAISLEKPPKLLVSKDEILSLGE